jgi:hypothetical protein
MSLLAVDQQDWAVKAVRRLSVMQIDYRNDRK